MWGCFSTRTPFFGHLARIPHCLRGQEESILGHFAAEVERLATESERGSFLPLEVEGPVTYSIAMSVPGPTPSPHFPLKGRWGRRTEKRKKKTKTKRQQLKVFNAHVHG